MKQFIFCNPISTNKLLQLHSPLKQILLNDLVIYLTFVIGQIGNLMFVWMYKNWWIRVHLDTVPLYCLNLYSRNIVPL